MGLSFSQSRDACAIGATGHSAGMIPTMPEPSIARPQAYAAVSLLTERFPAIFARTGERRPLKIGIAVDLLAHGLDRQMVHDGLRSYCGSYRYLAGLQDGAVRIGLDGEPTGVVSSDEAAVAQQRLAKRLKPKSTPPQPAKAAQPELRRSPEAPPQAAPKASPKPPLEAPPAKAKTEPFRRGRSAGNKPVVVEVRRAPSWRSGPKRRVIDV
jgi:sRNA-binding protein